ncbi:hypothetical protein C5167_037622 [Papaver somniferum]|uniref:Ribosomal protein L7/L12 C-terminal domain-containing protein n=1 Tax=Papaver somniferum TaxID=3469 RepID=A0A4Y7IAJ2_PAPSO|nr:uncharacterized protein LOC113288655 [Papaver somniferum]XP_026393553.1 uncharacterized protein LOC113288655 [Papaver somniferum]XP_026393562.1 uncharacterized protein LOC113288655 [Papaver somniferum]XP_026393570.1 uncharacterized protein LOC113288655 [Papaver somniferum]XP_026393577.1 uncharacterized protein LOC113288655 [Papaver somniferum]XP_026393584.1 uncharacterized protein LOC113288655 [Papaver somniferum]RZC44661.1 hypothetical protein C5167_037622 [Papaver somniferum]
MRYLNYILRTSRNPRILSLKDSSFLGYLSQSINPNSSIPNERSWNNRFASTSTEEVKPSERVISLVDEISDLTLLEVADLTEVLMKKLNINEMPIMTMMIPGMGIGGKVGGGVGGASKGGEEKKAAEKTAFDLKLEGFDAAGKIKIIKEVRTFTDLGLKEAKELVEKAPTLLKKGVTKEEAEKIIEKMTAIGAKVTME